MNATSRRLARRRAAQRSRRPMQPLRLAILGVALLIVLYPLVWMLGSSFKSETDIVSNLSPVPTDFTAGNYAKGWNGFDVSFTRFFLNSTVLAVMTVVANAASCIVTAYAFARLKFRLRRFWFVIMIATLLLPGDVLIIPQYILFNSLGWIDTPLLPLVVPKILATEAFFVFLMVQFMRGVPRELDEAARIDGCTPFGLFRHIILPLSMPALVTTAIFSFIWSWNDFFIQLVYLNQLEDYTVPIALRLFIDSTGQSSIGAMFAMSVLSLVPIFLFFLAFQRLLVQGINTSGLKG
jgi:multiple sugar transport system permease protein